jgi:hypothetical protein
MKFLSCVLALSFICSSSFSQTSLIDSAELKAQRAYVETLKFNADNLAKDISEAPDTDGYLFIHLTEDALVALTGYHIIYKAGRWVSKSSAKLVAAKPNTTINAGRSLTTWEEPNGVIRFWGKIGTGTGWVLKTVGGTVAVLGTLVALEEASVSTYYLKVAAADRPSAFKYFSNLSKNYGGEISRFQAAEDVIAAKSK